MAKAVFGIVQSQMQAADIVDRLKLEGFGPDCISVVVAGRSGSNAFAVEHQTKAPEGAATGAGAGALLGGALGWLTGIGALAIPGVGPLIAAGPIMAALSGAAVGGAVGGMTGGLVGLGIPEFEAKRYEGKVKSGNVLISVHAENSDEVERAKVIMETGGAEDITTATEPSLADRG
jgi:hypothetical protein